ncbi:unnamed protein product [Soboliphyme baturini]|uniref:BTB domain-containing protein n=1 Tax=Soboliphyme baturini TaxID=241478 RepID=A0A183ITN4_9BILA|nr:unnamed protein product [Soboliphyme baturini]
MALGVRSCVSGKLTIKDMDFDVALEMINYMYCGRCDKIGELGADLLVAADKYSLPDLKLRCEKALISALNTENACDLLIMADTHSASRLKEKAIEFFVTHSSPITQTPGWQMILRQRPDLITEVVRSFVNPRAETEAMSS